MLSFEKRGELEDFKFQAVEKLTIIISSQEIRLLDMEYTAHTVKLRPSITENFISHPRVLEMLNQNYE
jgi:hypothetical protein